MALFKRKRKSRLDTLGRSQTPTLFEEGGLRLERSRERERKQKKRGDKGNPLFLRRHIEKHSSRKEKEAEKKRSSKKGKVLWGKRNILFLMKKWLVRGKESHEMNRASDSFKSLGLDTISGDDSQALSHEQKEKKSVGRAPIMERIPLHQKKKKEKNLLRGREPGGRDVFSSTATEIPIRPYSKRGERSNHY